MSEDAATTTETTESGTTETTTETATERTFSQADVDRIVQDRLARAKTAPPADYEDLKAAAAKLAEIEAANKTELEKAQERAAQLEKEMKAAQELAQRTKIESAIVAEAARRGADTELVLPVVQAQIEVDDNGNPTNVAEAMDALLKAKPHLVIGGSRGNADQGARAGGADQLTREQLASMSSEEIVKAQAEGRLNTVLGRAR